MKVKNMAVMMHILRPYVSENGAANGAPMKHANKREETIQDSTVAHSASLLPSLPITVKNDFITSMPFRAAVSKPKIIPPKLAVMVEYIRNGQCLKQSSSVGFRLRWEATSSISSSRLDSVATSSLEAFMAGVLDGAPTVPCGCLISTCIDDFCDHSDDSALLLWLDIDRDRYCCS